MSFTTLYHQIATAVFTLCLLITPTYVGATPVAVNATTNSANNGLAMAGDDGSVYYLDLTGDIYAGGQENIYRLQPHTTNPIIICADEAWNLTISGKYLYYSNWSDQHALYRLNPNTNEKTKISNQPISQLNAVGDWLVYYSRGNNGSKNAIYKLALDGQSEPQKIVDDQAENLCVAGDWVYYLNVADSYRMYKIKLDGTSRHKLADDQVLFMAVANDTIYYSNGSDNHKLYTITIDGQKRTKLTDDKASFINVSTDFVYYTNASANHAVYRINIKNHSKQLVCDLNIGPQPILLVNNLLYYNRLFFKL